MDAAFAQELRQRRALACSGLHYGKKPKIEFQQDSDAFKLIGLALLLALGGWLLVFASEWILQPHLKENIAYLRAKYSALFILFAYLLLPYLKIIWLSIKNHRWEGFESWRHLTATQKTVANVTLGYLFMLGFITVFSFIKFPTALTSHKEFKYLGDFLLWGILSLFIYLITARLLKKATSTSKNPQRKPKKSFVPYFGLWLGESTGWLTSLSHNAGIAPKQQVALFEDDTAQNILILGATGGGKTTRVINPLLLQLLDQNCGGLIFDIKGDFHQTVAKLSQKVNTSYTAIGASQRPFNLLASLSPEIAASFLKSALLLNSGQKQDGFWIDTATELCRNVLGMLSFNQNHYSLHGLYNFLFDSSWRNQYYEEMEKIESSIDEKKQRLLKSYQRYYETIFGDFDEKVQAGVKATIAQVLAPFNHPELIDAFCTAKPDSANLEDVLKGKVFVIDMPLSRWGLGGKVVYTFIKLRFFNLMQSRVTHPEWDQNRFVFFLCDEYQEIVSANKDGLSDLNFWDKSRSSKTIGIISTQSISSFYAAVGDRDMANALLQNFRQKICFRTEDETTIALMNRLLGVVQVQQVTKTQNNGSSGQSSSASISNHDRPLLDGQFFRALPRDHALVLLSYCGYGFDDVLKMEAVYS